MPSETEIKRRDLAISQLLDLVEYLKRPDVDVAGLSEVDVRVEGDYTNKDEYARPAFNRPTQFRRKVGLVVEVYVNVP